MVFWYQNCSDLKIAYSREFAKILRSLEQFIQTVKKRTMFGNRMLFLTCTWRFLRPNKLEQLKFKFFRQSAVCNSKFGNLTNFLDYNISSTY